MASALVFKWCQDLYSNLVPTAFAASRRPRGAVIPAGEVDSRFVVPLPRPGGRRSLRGQLHLDLRPLEAHEDASISTVLTDATCAKLDDDDDDDDVNRYCKPVLMLTVPY